MIENEGSSPNSDRTESIPRTQLSEAERKEKQEAQVEAAVQFALYLTSKYPQVDIKRMILEEVYQGVVRERQEFPGFDRVRPQLNYYLAGSLATSILARAEVIELCTETNGSDIEVKRSVPIPPETRATLTRLARPIGDIDFVTTPHYEKQLDRAQKLSSSVSQEDRRRIHSQYLWKGAAGPTFGELPEAALPALSRKNDQDDDFCIFCDPVQKYGTLKYARVTVEDREFYIAQPDTIIGYKALHMLQMFHYKAEKFNTDFPQLYEAIVGLYSEAELISMTHSILEESEPGTIDPSGAKLRPRETKLPRMYRDLMLNPALGTEIRSFMEKLFEYDQTHGQLLGNRSFSRNAE